MMPYSFVILHAGAHSYTHNSPPPPPPLPSLLPFVNKTVKDFYWAMHGWAILGRIACRCIHTCMSLFIGNCHHVTIEALKDFFFRARLFRARSNIIAPAHGTSLLQTISYF
jgi:hypothetical protein